MKVSELASALKWTPISVPEMDREVDGVYIGDLLSWVMGRASADNVWITIMSNVNVVAVASLVDVACIVLAEGVVLDETVAETARQKGINVYSATEPAYEIASALSRMLE